ncbi:MAG: UbiA family prenyltransferase [Verrucomicrobiota bacterium]
MKDSRTLELIATEERTESANFGLDVPLCVDLDGTFLRADSFQELILLLAKAAPLALVYLPLWLMRGKAYMKQQIAGLVSLDVTTLPLNYEFCDFLQAESRRGRRLILVTAADSALANAIAAHHQIFDEVLASNGVVNLAGDSKAMALVDRFGYGKFDYAGNDHADIAVWRSARRAIVVNASAAVLEEAQRVADIEQTFPPTGRRIQSVLRVLRVNQWVKNCLLFIPLIGANAWADWSKVLSVLLSFVAFCLCASGVHVLNDLLDLETDRNHTRKRFQPFARGRLPVTWGMLGAPILLLAGAFIACLLPWQFGAVLGVYCLTTVLYSSRLRKVAALDVFVLASLYTTRVVAGCYAANVVVSNLLIGFSMFLFLALALVKRFSELRRVRRKNALLGGWLEVS